MLSDKPVLIDLSYKGLIRASGADVVPFLQGQLSTDIEQLTPDRCQLSSWSNAKGRVVALLHVFRRGDDIYLALAAALKSTVLKRLSMYVLRSKLSLTDAGNEFGCLGLVGTEAGALLAQAGLPAPAQVNELTSAGTLQVMRFHGETPRYALYGPADEVATLRRRWEASSRHGIEGEWALRRILAGEPTVHPETSEHFVAQMLDLDKLGAIDFKKGCYIGQEVIARAHYRGGVKRHMARAECKTPSILKPGMEIHDVERGSPVAEIADARRDEAGVWQMLLVVQDDFRNVPLTIGSMPVTLV